MTIEQLQQVSKARPFRPFTISLSDGQVIPVTHPECIMIPPRASRTFVVATSPESVRIVGLLHVTCFEFTNGKTGRARRR